MSYIESDRILSDLVNLVGTCAPAHVARRIELIARLGTALQARRRLSGMAGAIQEMLEQTEWILTAVGSVAHGDWQSGLDQMSAEYGSFCALCGLYFETTTTLNIPDSVRQNIQGAYRKAQAAFENNTKT